MVASFFTWITPLLMIGAGVIAAIFGLIASTFDATGRAKLVFGGGVALGGIGLVLTGINLWELF